MTLRESLAQCHKYDAAIDDARRRRDEWRADVGRMVRDTRKARGISQTDLANRCGVSKAMLSDFEYGRRWSDKLVAEIVKVLR